MNFIFFMVACLSSLALIAMAIWYLTKKSILCTPNARSSHDVPTPRGGGLGMMPVIFAGMGYLLWRGELDYPCTCAWLAVLGGGIILSLVSWMDDKQQDGISPKIRLLIQMGAVILPLVLWPLDAGKVFPDFVPVIVERVLLFGAWVWFLNLYNFMDGINGITGVETVSISGGIAALALFGGLAVTPGFVSLNLIICGAALGFLFWNARPRAKVFLGDIGSISLGYLLAFVLFVLAAQGYLVIALLLPLVYLVDATYRIIKRSLRKEKIWQPHREHFYQQATVKNGFTHLQTSAWILGANLLLILTAWLMLKGVLYTICGFAIGLVIVWQFLRFFAQTGRKAAIVSSGERAAALPGDF